MGVGKWIGGIVGPMVGGPLGVLVGHALGSLIDFDNNPTNDTTAYGNEHTKEDVLADQWNSLLFPVLVMASYIIWVDGRIIYSETEYVRDFSRANFGVAAVGEDERILLSLLEQRKCMDMQNPPTFKNTIRDCDMQIAANLTYEERLQLLGFLANIVRSDNSVCHKEIGALKEVAAYMGSSEKEVELMLNLGGNSLDAAYKILEIDPTATDEEVRVIYRKLALKRHPDRVVTLGEDIKCIVEEKSQSIDSAKEIIYKARGMKQLS